MIKEFQKEYRWLSNFTPVEIELNGIKYPSVEHAYMSAKVDSDEWRAFCSNPNNKAGQVKKASYKFKKSELVQNFDEIKVDVMRECLIQKFNQEPFKSKLIATGDLHIQEGNLWNDKFWGFCLKTNQGQNILGHLIMEIRKELLKYVKPPLSLRPRFIVYEHRLQEIEEAIERYNSANRNIPFEWVEEKHEILEYLEGYQNKILANQLLSKMKNIPPDVQEIVNNNFDKTLLNI